MGDSNHRRADWRFLLPEGPRAHTLIVDRFAGDDRPWRWLVEDGWTERLTVTDGRTPDRTGRGTADDPTPTEEPVRVSNPVPAGVSPPADVILVRSKADLAVAVDRAAATASIVVELPRSAGELLRPMGDRLVTAGFTEVRCYLATPNLDDPRRLTPLTGSPGLRWLLGPPPFTARGRVGRTVAAAVRTAAIAVAEAALSTRLAAVAGDRLLVAGRGLGQDDPATWPGGRSGGVVVMTSGHDEGSRIILLPLEDGRSEPREVLKISPRPGFNRNVEMEHKVLQDLRSAMTNHTDQTDRTDAVDNRPGRGPIDLIPRPLGLVTVDGLVASRECYAGRWTASDLGHRQPRTRGRVLRTVFAAATELAVATRTGVVPWSDSLFDRLVLQLHDRHIALTGPSGERDELIAALAERSQRLVGRPLPMMRRHYDLGPWNVVFGSDGRPTVIDWELAPPRTLDAEGPAGADHLYFAKYWLHICLGTQSPADELRAFEFLGPPGPAEGHSAGDGRSGRDDRNTVSEALAAELHTLGIDRGFVPLLAAHIWLEKSLYTMARQGPRPRLDPGEAGAYLDALARHRHRLLARWSPGPR